MFDVVVDPEGDGVGVGGGGGGGAVDPTVTDNVVLWIAPLESHAFTTTVCAPALIVNIVSRLPLLT
jgi:hypothetical protein